MLAVVCVVLPAWDVCPAAEGRKEPARLDYYGDSLPPGAVARLGSTRFLLPGAVRALTFSRDGNTLASASHHVVMLWDRKTGRTIRQFPVDKFEVRAITFTDAGQILVLGGGHVDAWPTDKKDPDTRAYVERRTKEGKSKRDIMRCLKRYVARELFPLLAQTTA